MDSRERIARELLGKTVHVEIDRPVGYLHGDIRYPINYGYIPGVIAGDGEEQDAYILGVSEPIASFDGRVIGVIRRLNDCEDKLVVAPEGTVFHQGEIAAATAFQEQYFITTIDSLFRKSCGVIPFRRTGDDVEFLLLYQRASRTWSFPKGHMDAGETEIQTALRELAEETGLRSVLIPGARAVVEYSVSPLTRKQVVLFLGEVTGEPVIQEQEIEAFRWVKRTELQDYVLPDTLAACEKLAEHI